MKLIKTKITNGPLLLKSNIYNDKRGFLRETYNHKILKKKFPFDIMSYSKKNVLRGLHIQLKNPQAKLVTVTYGKIFDVAVDLRKKSKTFGKYVSQIISHDNDISFYIPEGFAHGFLSLSSENLVFYGNTKYREKKHEITIKWNDKDLGIKWPKSKKIISKKDLNGIELKKILRS